MVEAAFIKKGCAGGRDVLVVLGERPKERRFWDGHVPCPKMDTYEVTMHYMFKF